MKRAARNALLALALPLAATATAPAATADAGEGREVFYVTLLKEASYGLSKVEHAAWLVRDREGAESLVAWPRSGLTRAHIWKGPPPPGTIALLHTHPSDGNPRPSATDVRTASSLRLPVYTITRWGIYRADPNESVVQLTSPIWCPSIDWSLAEQLLERTEGEAQLASAHPGSTARVASRTAP